MTETYQVDFTLSEIEEMERALMVYQDHMKQYDNDIAADAQKNINSIVTKLNKV